MKFIGIGLTFAIISVSCATKFSSPLQVTETYAKSDTIGIFPYEVVIGFKGKLITRITCNPINKSNIKLSIKGFENSSEIPLNILRDSLQLVLSDNSVDSIYNGTITFRNPTLSHWRKLNGHDLRNRMSLERMFRGLKPFRHEYVITFNCFEIKKRDSIFTIPVRSYLIKQE